MLNYKNNFYLKKTNSHCKEKRYVSQETESLKNSTKNLKKRFEENRSIHKIKRY